MNRAFLLTLLLLASPASSAEPPIALRVPPQVAPDLAAMPQIAHPADPAQARINAALARLDDTVRKARAACTNTRGDPTSWERGIDVPMRGPRFLSVVVADAIDCGGAHPDTATMAIVYDLRTGRPVDWPALLSPALAGKLTLSEGEDGTRTVRLTSTRLTALYHRYYDHGQADDADGCKAEIAQLSGGGATPLSAWLDAKQGGLVLQTDLPHAMQACADPVLIPAVILKREGASPDLVAALEAGLPLRGPAREQSSP